MKTTTTAPKRDLDCVIAYLETGLSLSIRRPDGSERRFYAGQITRQRNNKGSVRTTHVSADLDGYVWVTEAGLARMADTARANWSQIEAMQSAAERQHRAAMGHE